MSMTDPIADLLSRIRNAHLAKHDRLDIPASKLKAEVCRLLKQTGFVRGGGWRHGGRKINEPFRVRSEPAHYL